MVASARDSHRVELGLNAVEAVLRDLPSVAAAWASLEEDERIVFSLEWGNEMARLRQLRTAEASEDLSAAQAARLRTLVAWAESERPTIESLGLSSEPISLANTSAVASRSVDG